MAPTGEPDVASGDAIRRAVLRQTLRHPLTVLPVSLGALTAIGGAVAGPAVIFLGAGMLLSSIGVGAWAVNYFVRPQRFADRFVRKMERRREAERAAQVLDIRRELMSLGATEGVKAWDELAAAHEQLGRALAKREGEGVALDFATLRDLAGRTLEEGLGHLRVYINIARALRLIDAGRLEGEAEQLRQRLRKLPQKGDSPEGKRTKDAIEAQLQSIESRLKKHREGKVRLEEILAACEKCEGELEAGALEISTTREVSARFERDAAERLRANLEIARRFNESLGRDDEEERDRAYDRNRVAKEEKANE